jgi:hypothetical protein
MKPRLMASKVYPSAMVKYLPGKEARISRIAEDWLEDFVVEFSGIFQIFADSLPDICQRLEFCIALRPTTWQPRNGNAESLLGVR